MAENVALTNKHQNQFSLVWRDIFYEVETKVMKNGEFLRKTILNNVSGYAKSGEVTAIMGPSGCGKTSLLNFLNNRIQFAPNSKNSGDTFINSDKLDLQQISRLSSYVMQDDVFFHFMTPKETLLFTSKLRKKQSNEEHEKQVMDLIEELKLTKCMNTRIGDERHKGISGGEKKRVSIGVEIISNPSILYLDEPTSGLDSQTSYIVIDFLKGLAKSKNIIVIFTIHQPSSNIFSLFNKLIILNKGQEVYQGPSMDVIPYFESIKFPLGSRSNPADAFMHLMEEQNSRLEKKQIEDYKNIQKKKETGEQELAMSDLYIKNVQPKVNEEINSLTNSGHADFQYKNLDSVGIMSQFGLLAQRSLMKLGRDPLALRIRFVMVIIFSIIACSIFYDMKNDVTGILNKSGFFFFFTVNNFMTTLFDAVLTFPLERGVFIREYSSKLYGVVPYYLSKNLVETPIGLSVTFVFCLIVYYIVGLRQDVTNYFIFCCIYICLAFLSQSMGLCFGASFSNLNSALVITQFSVLPSFLFSGFLINQENMPAWLAWLRFLSPFRYAIEAGARNEFDGNPNIPPALNIVNNLNLDIGMWNCVGIMVAFGVVLRILGLIFLKILVRKTG